LGWFRLSACQTSDLPQYSKIRKGDTLMTVDWVTRFGRVAVGTVSSFELKTGEKTYTGGCKNSHRFQKLRHAFVVKN